VNRHDVTTPTAALISAPAPSSPHSIPIESPRPVLRQTGSGQWAATILLADVLPACYFLSAQGNGRRSSAPLALLSFQGDPKSAKVLWDLIVQEGSRTLTVPDRTAQVIQVGAAISATSLTTASFTAASSCEVMLTFAGLPQVPETATLVLNDAGASFAIPLAVSRYVPAISYWAIPIFGLSFAFFLIISMLVFIRVPGPDGGRLPIRRLRSWRRHRVMASSVWSARDSWATNITSGILAVALILASTTAAASLFPGVTLTRFVLIDMVAGGIVLAAPAIFGILHAQWDRDRKFRTWLRQRAAPARPVRAGAVGPSAADNTMTASLATVLITAAVTMFGIGAEIGTAVVLVSLSGATLTWRLVMGGGLTLAVVLVLWYSVAAISALVDGMSGSILASPSDTSFTL
jgi:hypothetical protein